MNTNQSAVPDRATGESSTFSTSGLWWGALLVAAGVLWLVDAAGPVNVPALVVASLFAVAGIGFAVDFALHPTSWWAAIPAGALIGLGALIALVTSTTAADEWGASMLLGGTGLGFAAVSLRHRTQWWALVPAAVLFGVAIIVGYVPIMKRGEDIAVVVLAILAVACIALALIPIRGRRMLWALIPAGVLLVVAGFLTQNAIEVLEPYNWVSAAALLVVGLLVVVRSLSRRGPGRQGP
jgi:hypothetical protein